MATKKTTTKKTAPKPVQQTVKSNKKAGMAKPTWKIDTAANKSMTQRNTLFFTLPQGRTTLRIMPPFDGSNTLFTASVLHYKVKSPVDAAKNIAPACLREYGDGNCYLCNLAEWLKATDEAILQEMGSELYGTNQLIVQAFVYDKDSKEWFGPRLVKVSKSVGAKLSDMLSVAADNDMPYFCDPEQGQGVTIIKSGEGKTNTRYDVQPTSKFENMDNIVPGWEKLVIKDICAKLDVKVLSMDEQKQAAFQTWPELPWAEIEKAIG